MSKDKLFPILAAIIISGIGVFISITFNINLLQKWYDSLEKPFFYISVLWIICIKGFFYILTGITLGRIWAYGVYHKWVKVALYHFFAQWLLSCLWVLIFFGFHHLLLGGIIILGQIILVERTAHWFYIINKKVAFIIYLYLVWLLYIATLNISTLILQF